MPVATREAMSARISPALPKDFFFLISITERLVGECCCHGRRFSSSLVDVGLILLKLNTNFIIWG